MERQPFLFLSGLKLLGATSGPGSLSLGFDEGTLAVFNPVSASGFEGQVTAIEAARTLCGCTVLDAYSQQGHLSLDFGGLYLHISLKDKDYASPEAACWSGKDGKIIVIN